MNDEVNRFQSGFHSMAGATIHTDLVGAWLVTVVIVIGIHLGAAAWPWDEMLRMP